MMSGVWFWLLLSVVQAKIPQDTTVLQRVLAAAHADKSASIHDQFATPTVDDHVAGTSFNATLNFRDGDMSDGSEGSAYYTFDDGKLTLILSLDDMSYRDRTADNSIKLLEIGELVTDQRSYLASNAMGARRRVSARTEIVDALAVFDRPDGDWLPGLGDHSFEENNLPKDAVRSEKSAYVLTLNLSGPAAKALVRDAEVVVSGTIRPMHGGKVTGCYDHVLEPTFSDPVDVLTRYCWVGAKLSKIVFRRRSTGETLREWKAG